MNKNDFLVQVLGLGSDLSPSSEGIAIVMALRDAEIFYDEHFGHRKQNKMNDLEKNELEKYKKVHSTETLKELADVIRSFGVDGEIQGRTRKFNSEQMAMWCEVFTWETHNLLTREFGIRQQAMMILFYEEDKKPL